MDINYSLNIKKEQKIFTPNSLLIEPIISSQNRIFEIKARNGYGKTFLLNLIAYSLRGTELKENKDTIKKSLKDIISRYNDSEYYNLEYNLKFDLPDGKELLATKFGDEINTCFKLNESTEFDSNCGANNLHKELTILYDVPTDPAERLNGVLANITNWNDNIYKSVTEKLRTLEDLSLKSSQTKNQELIESLKKEFEKYNKTLSDLDTGIKANSELYKKLQIIEQLKQLNEEYREFEVLFQTNKHDIDRLATLKKPQQVQKRDETKLYELNRNKTTEINSLKVLIISLFKIVNNPEINQFISLNENLRDYNQIQNFDYGNIAQIDIDEINEIKKQLHQLVLEINDFISQKEKSPENKLAAEYEFFASFLDKINSEIFSEIFKTQKDEILKIVQNKLQKLKPESNFENEKAFLENCESQFNVKITNIFKIENAISNESKKSIGNDKLEIEYNLAVDKASTSESNLRKCKSRISTIKGKLSMWGVSETHLENKQNSTIYLSSIQSDSVIRGLAMNLNSSLLEISKKIEISKIEESTQKQKREIVRLKLDAENEKMPEILSEFQRIRLTRLIKVFRAISIVLSKFNTISNLTKERKDLNLLKSETVDLIGSRFLMIAGNIIAQSMENKIIRSDGNFENFNSIDLLKQEYILDDGRIIKQADISTGQSSGNYLKQRILNLEGKYIVVLLDEIGNMDEFVLKEVISAIKEIDKQKRLVLALLAQPGSGDITVIPY